MNSRLGSVIEVDAERGVIIVRPDTPVVCTRCAAGRGCGAGLGVAAPGNLELPLEPDAVTPAAGDRVELTLPGGSLLRAAAIVYGCPLLGALGAAVIGSLFFRSDGLLALFALCGLGAGFLIARRQAGRRCLLPSVSAV